MRRQQPSRSSQEESIVSEIRMYLQGSFMVILPMYFAARSSSDVWN